MRPSLAAGRLHVETATIEGVGHGGPIQAGDAFGKLALGFIDAR
ncbi:hypothetical protein [Amaricoccus sp.]|nr:hypothetical protein [Amaricoccus sp.]